MHDNNIDRRRASWVALTADTSPIVRRGERPIPWPTYHRWRLSEDSRGKAPQPFPIPAKLVGQKLLSYPLSSLAGHNTHGQPQWPKLPKTRNCRLRLRDRVATFSLSQTGTGVWRQSPQPTGSGSITPRKLLESYTWFGTFWCSLVAVICRPSYSVHL